MWQELQADINRIIFMKNDKVILLNKENTILLETLYRYKNTIILDLL